MRRMRGRWWLAATRPRGRPEGTWVLPKGLVDPGERAAEAALRETYEETGLRCRVEAKIADVRYVYTWAGERVFKIVSFYLMRPSAGRIGAIPPGMEHEVAEARWLPLDEASALLTHRSERDVAARAASAIADREPL